MKKKKKKKKLSEKYTYAIKNEHDRANSDNQR